MLKNVKPCGECGTPQAIARDGSPHCPICESELFPIGEPLHKDNIVHHTNAQRIVDVPLEESEVEE